MLGARILEMTDDDFDDTLAGLRVPVMVDFWAPWGAPCKTILPALAQLAVEFEGRARIAKVNVDENGYLSHRFGIRSIPTLIVFKHGKVVGQLVGAAPEQEIRRLIETHLD